MGKIFIHISRRYNRRINKVVKENNKICKYFDISNTTHFWHSFKKNEQKVYRTKHKKYNKQVKKRNSRCSNKNNFNGWFPGETQEDFEKLYEFVKETKFDKLGAFTYSKEDGTPASRLKEQIHPMTKKSRYNKIMKLQQEISKENEKKNIGRELEILIEGITPDKKYYVGRSYMDVPDIDGRSM